MRPTNADLILDDGSQYWGGGSPFLGGWSHNLQVPNFKLEVPDLSTKLPIRRDPAEFNHIIISVFIDIDTMSR